MVSRLIALVIWSALLVVPGSAYAQDSLEWLELPDATAEELTRALEGVREQVEGATDESELPFTTVGGDVTVVSRASSNLRHARARRLDQAIDYAAAVLETEGWSSDALPRLLHVEVTLREGTPGVHWSEDRRAVVVRNLPSRRVSGLPELERPEDGHPTQRAVVQATEETRLAMWNLARARASAGIDTGRERLAAEFALSHVSGGAELPGWLRAGLTEFLIDSVRRGPPRRREHVCGTRSNAIEDVAARALGTGEAPTTEDLRLFGLVLAQRASESDLASDVARLAEALSGGTATAEAFEAAFGVTPQDAFAAARGEEEPAVDCEGGVLPCPICAGEASLTVACASCKGLGDVLCPSCLGDEICDYCSGVGKRYWSDGDDVKCEFCDGKGETKCRSCLNRRTHRCRHCTKGRVERDCAVCEGGSIPCPWSDAATESEVDDSACTWCGPADAVQPCGTCHASRAVGCRNCSGTLRKVCRRCSGTGRLGKSYGLYVSTSRCDECEGEGYFDCEECKRGDTDCEACDEKGVVPAEPANCALCLGTSKVPTGKVAMQRIADRRAPPSAEEAKRFRAMLDRAVEFLLTCRQTPESAFALRDFRAHRGSPAGALWESNIFSNGYTLYALAVVGIEPDDRRVYRAWQALRAQVDAELRLPPAKQGVQALAIALRALSVAGSAEDEERIELIVEALDDGQVRGGGWNGDLEGEGDADELDSLMALESLWLAHRNGVKVPRSVWRGGMRAARDGFRGSKKIDGMNNDFVIGTHVASNTAMWIMSKSAMLGDDAAGFDYESIPQVAAGLAWLDRYFSIDSEPSFNHGAFRHDKSDAGYSAYLFAIQRLAMLLNIGILGGERWHRTGALHLETIQFDDGSFEEMSTAELNGPVRTTIACVLFLARATPPVTEASRDR